MSDAQAADPKGGGRNQCTCPAEPLRKHTGPYHNGQCSPGFAISLSAPDTTNADNVLAIAKRATSGDTVAPLSRTVYTNGQRFRRAPCRLIGCMSSALSKESSMSVESPDRTGDE